MQGTVNATAWDSLHMDSSVELGPSSATRKQLRLDNHDLDIIIDNRPMIVHIPHTQQNRKRPAGTS